MFILGTATLISGVQYRVSAPGGLPPPLQIPNSGKAEPYSFAYINVRNYDSEACTLDAYSNAKS